MLLYVSGGSMYREATDKEILDEVKKRGILCININQDDSELDLLMNSDEYLMEEEGE